MKYFSLDWWNGIQKSEPKDDPFEKYQEYFESIKSHLPQAFFDLRESIFLHDGELRSIDLQLENNTLSLKVFTDNDGLLREVILLYTGVTSFASNSQPKKGLPGPRGYGDWGYDEVELINDKLEHRVLFSSGIEISIQFSDLILTQFIQT